MTEYTTDPEAIAHYLAARARTAHWVDSLNGKTLAAPSFPPSLVSDTDDGLSSQDSDAESSHSLPPRMVLRYPDGRPDVPVSTDTRWPPHGQKPTTPTPFHTRPRAGSGSHGYPPSNPNIHSRAPSNHLYISPPPPVMATQPEPIHVRPSPTSPIPQQDPGSYFPSDPHQISSPSAASRQRSMRSTPSSRRPPVSLQMIYTPPAPAHSSQSRSAPVSPTHESFLAAQQPPPLPAPSAPHPPIAAPSPVYGFPSPISAQEPPPAGPPTHSRTHTRSHSYSSNNSYPHPQAASGPASAPPSSYPGNPSQRQRRHSSRTGTSHGHAEVVQPQPQAPAPYTDSSHVGMGVGGGPSFASGASGSGSRRRGPPSIVYAPSANSSSYMYNPPVITSRPPHHDAHGRAPAQRIAQSISDPTPMSASLGRHSSRGRMVEHLSRTPSPGTARARANEASGMVAKGAGKKDRLRGSRDNSRRRDGDRNGHRDDYNDEAASFSSGSTYYVLPTAGQKIKVVVRYNNPFCPVYGR